MNIVLDHSVHKILLQFSFSNPDIAPSAIMHLPKENDDESIRRNQRKQAGTEKNELIPAGKNPELVNVESLPADILLHGNWEFVATFCQTRNHTNGSSVYYTARFVFSRPHCAEPTEAFYKNFRGLAYAELQALAMLGLWRVRLYKNPLFKDGKPVKGAYEISINLDARQPMYEQDGKQCAVAGNSRCSLRYRKGALNFVGQKVCVKPNKKTSGTIIQPKKPIPKPKVTPTSKPDRKPLSDDTSDFYV